MTVIELIERLEEAAVEDPEMSVAVSFEHLNEKEASVRVASVELENVLMCLGEGYVILHFQPIPILQESLQIAEAIQNVIDNEGAEVLGEDADDLENPDEEGLSF